MTDQLDLGFELTDEQRALADAVAGLPSEVRFRMARSIAGNEWRLHPRAERRDPAAALQKVTWTAPGQEQIPRFDAETAIQMSYLLNSIVYRCANVIADAFCRAPFVAGPDPKRRKNTDSKSRLMQLLGPPPGTPAPRWSARKLFHWSVRSKVITGKCGWEVECVSPRGKGKLVALWPLVPSLLAPVPTDGGRDFFSSFKYGPPGRTKRTLVNDQVFYIWTAALSDPREPETALQAGRLDIGAATMFDRFTLALLKNHNIPANIVSYLEFEDEDEELAWQRQFSSRNNGPDQAGKTLFHKVSATGADGEGVKGALIVQQLGALQRDTQALETYKTKVMNICIVMGVPMSMLDASNRTFSNGGLEAQNFYEQRMQPEWQEWSEEINSQIAPRVGPEVGWFDLSGIQALRPPMKFQQTSPTELRREGLVHRDEIRDELGFGPWNEATENLTPDEISSDDAPGVPDLKDLAQAALFLAQAGFDLDSIAEKLGLPSGLKPKAEDPVEPDADDPMMEPPLPVPDPATTGRARYRERRSLDPEVVRVQVSAVIGGLEASWQRSWTRFFQRQADATLSRLQGKRGRQALADVRALDPQNQPVDSLLQSIFDQGFWQTTTEDFATQLLEGVFTAGGARISGQFGLSFDAAFPGVEQAIVGRASRLAGQVTSTTYDALQAILIEGVQAGEDVAALSDRVQSIFSDRSSTGAERIARTEVVGAYQQAAHSFARSLPGTVVAGHSWLAHHDQRTRESHSDPELSRPIAIAEPFRVGGFHMMHPGDPGAPPEEVINCRCVELFYAPEDMPGFSDEPVRTPMVGRNRTIHALLGVATGNLTPEAAIAELSANGGH